MRSLFLLPVLLLFAITVGAQDKATWSFEYKQIKGNEYELICKASIIPGWRIFSIVPTGEDGPNPTELIFNEGAHFKTSTKLSEEGIKHYKFDGLFAMNLRYFQEHMTLRQKVTVTDLKQPITGEVVWLACNDFQCLYKRSKFTFTIKGAKGKGLFVPYKPPVRKG